MDDIRSKLPGGCVPFELLPNPEHCGPCSMTIDADWLGRVRVTLEPWSYKSHRSRYWAWRVVYAEVAEVRPE